MPRRFFRKFQFKRDRLKGQWWIAPVDHLVHDPALWGIRRRTVVPAFSLGLFIAFAGAAVIGLGVIEQWAGVRRRFVGAGPGQGSE